MQTIGRDRPVILDRSQRPGSRNLGHCAQGPRRYNPPRPGQAMTVCIAACCQEQDGPVIVLGADSRMVDSGGANDYTQKIKPVGPHWAALLAGDWTGSGWIARKIKEVFQSVDAPRTEDAIIGSVENVCAQFIESSISSPEQVCDL